MRYFEFFIVGVVIALSENLLAIWLATDAEITLRVIFIATIAGIPFAYFSEMVVDKPGFWKKAFKVSFYEDLIDFVS